MKPHIEAKAKAIVEHLHYDESIGEYINGSLNLPQAYGYQNQSQAKLIILGQDPTIQKIENCEKITTVLNLDKSPSVRAYLKDVCLGLDIDLEQNVYATNLFKNFFRVQPIKIKGLLDECFAEWLDLLWLELNEFPLHLPVMTLGQPVIKLLLRTKSEHPLREHWGYRQDWKSTRLFQEMKYVPAENNCLGRMLFPFPHIRTSNNPFYHFRREAYVKFVRDQAFSV